LANGQDIISKYINNKDKVDAIYTTDISDIVKKGADMSADEKKKLDNVKQ